MKDIKKKALISALEKCIFNFWWFVIMVLTFIVYAARHSNCIDMNTKAIVMVILLLNVTIALKFWRDSIGVR